jgi:hypothetical protein
MTTSAVATPVHVEPVGSIARASDGTLWKSSGGGTWVALGAETASNVGSGAGVWKEKVGSDQRFRRLTGSNTVTVSENTNDITFAVNLSYAGSGFFGSGEGGNLNFNGTGSVGVLLFDGVTVFPTLAPVTQLNQPVDATTSRPTYTFVSDVYADNMTVAQNVHVLTAGFRLFVKGRLTLTGTIGNWGNDGVDAQQGDLQNGGGAGGAVRSANSVGGGTAGGAGGATGANGVNGTALSNGWWGQSQGAAAAAAGFGQGGGGGNRSDLGLNPGDGGSCAGMAASAGSANIQAAVGAVSGRSASGVIISAGSGGGGGTGGGPPASQGGGGGGGGGAGVCVVVAREIVGIGTLNCRGGFGGDAKQVDVDGAQAGGGGGGAGGILVCVIGTGSFPTTLVTGGTHGVKGGDNTNANGGGYDGGVGVAYTFIVGTVI